MMLARGVANGERTRNQRVCPVFESSNVTALVAAFEGAMSMTIERMESVLDDGTKVSIRELEPSDPGRSDALLGLLDVTAAPPRSVMSTPTAATTHALHLRATRRSWWSPHGNPVTRARSWAPEM